MRRFQYRMPIASQPIRSLLIGDEKNEIWLQSPLPRGLRTTLSGRLLQGS